MTDRGPELQLLSIADHIHAGATSRRQLVDMLIGPDGRAETVELQADLDNDPFADLFAAVSAPSTPMFDQYRIKPPPSRFMLRVAQVGRPHRPTKRNYNYFEELNAALAAKAEQQHSGEGSTQP